MKTIGLIGGMSWESSQHYYRLINQAVQQRLGGLHSARLLMHSVDFAPIEQLQHSGDWEGASAILVDAARRLEAGGADFFLICTNTMHRVADEVAAEGRKAYVIPGGGSNPVGATGYVACAQEILAQIFDVGINIDRIICASGSAGTHAGLVTGFYGNNSHLPVIGINVSRPKSDQEELVYDLVQRTAKHIGINSDIPREAVVCFDEYVGPGYSLPTPEMAEAVRMLARLEGVLIDPVYTGKAMAGLIDLVRKGTFNKDESILFVHTGGSPALYVYMDEILS